MFLNNYGTNGGVMELYWGSSIAWVTTITNSFFANNIAGEKGGAIYYNNHRPLMVNVTFIGNSAPYGNNIASFPIKIIGESEILDNDTLSDVASGQTLSAQIKFKLADYDNQVTSDYNGGRISIVPTTSNALTLGETSASIVSGEYWFNYLGVATFKSLILIAKPGSKDVKFRLTSSSIRSKDLLNKNN